MSGFTMTGENYLTIYRPDGITVFAQMTAQTVGHSVNMAPLPESGTYKIYIDPSGPSTGTITLVLSEELDAGTIAINGASAPVTISRIGQTAHLTFSGGNGQPVTVRVTNNSMAEVSVWLDDLTGAHLTGVTSSGASFNLSTYTLPATADYRVFIDPSSAVTGSMDVRVTSP